MKKLYSQPENAENWVQDQKWSFFWANLGQEHFISPLVRTRKEMTHPVLSINSHHVHNMCLNLTVHPPTISDIAEPISRTHYIMMMKYADLNRSF